MMRGSLAAIMASGLLAAGTGAPAQAQTGHAPDWPRSYRPARRRTAKGVRTKKARSRWRPRLGREDKQTRRRTRSAWITGRCVEGYPARLPTTVAMAADRMSNWQRCRWLARIAAMPVEKRASARADLDLALTFVSLRRLHGWTS